MSKAIEATNSEWPGQACDACGKPDGLKVFHFGGANSRMFLALCHTCGLQFSGALSTAFPSDPLPLWLKMMRRLS